VRYRFSRAAASFLTALPSAGGGTLVKGAASCLQAAAFSACLRSSCGSKGADGCLEEEGRKGWCW